MSDKINDIFTRIHKHYDFFNHLFSLGLDIQWRNRAAKEAMIDKEEFKLLDLATGTGDMAISVYREAKRKGKKVLIVGTDFNEPMLDHAKEKTRGLEGISFELDDALHTKYQKESFDVVTSAFSLRNFDDLNVFSKELDRILKSGGKFILLDMAKPDGFLSSTFIGMYFQFMNFISRFARKSSDNWLTYSIWRFDSRKMVNTLEGEGFKDIKLESIMPGIAFIITGIKP